MMNRSYCMQVMLDLTQQAYRLGQQKAELKQVIEAQEAELADLKRDRIVQLARADQATTLAEEAHSKVPSAVSCEPCLCLSR